LLDLVLVFLLGLYRLKVDAIVVLNLLPLFVHRVYRGRHRLPKLLLLLLDFYGYLLQLGTPLTEVQILPRARGFGPGWASQCLKLAAVALASDLLGNLLAQKVQLQRLHFWKLLDLLSNLLLYVVEEVIVFGALGGRPLLHCLSSSYSERAADVSRRVSHALTLVKGAARFR